uniref:Transposase n=1 Tax=Ditylenchus dipsaci TaxID=166011 RepID=A0A915D007_9BILA
MFSDEACTTSNKHTTLKTTEIGASNLFHSTIESSLASNIQSKSWSGPELVMESKRRCSLFGRCQHQRRSLSRIFANGSVSLGKKALRKSSLGVHARSSTGAQGNRNTRSHQSDVPEFIEVDISPQRNNGEWPATSPDLNPLDYSIWNELKRRACVKKHQTVEALKRSLVNAWNEIPQDMIDRAVDDFPKRLRKCIQANGGYFENK